MSDKVSLLQICEKFLGEEVISKNQSGNIRLQNYEDEFNAGSNSRLSSIKSSLSKVVIDEKGIMKALEGSTLSFSCETIVTIFWFIKVKLFLPMEVTLPDRILKVIAHTIIQYLQGLKEEK